MWIIVKPNCVLAGVPALVVHHIATMIFALIPYHEPRYHWHLTVTLAVEVSSESNSLALEHTISPTVHSSYSPKLLYRIYYTIYSHRIPSPYLPFDCKTQHYTSDQHFRTDSTAECPSQQHVLPPLQRGFLRVLAVLSTVGVSSPGNAVFF